MKSYLIYYLFITLSIFLNSCTEGFKEEYSKLVIALTEVTAITTPTTDTTPDYTFSSTESGAITYGGSCSSSTTIATTGNNTITLITLSVGTYADCTITVSKTISTENSEKKLSGSLTITSFTVSSSNDTTAPVIAEVTAVTNPTRYTTPNYTFSSSEAGTITYGGSCSSSTTSAISGNNTINFATTNDGWTYSDCTITVTDSAGNVSNTLAITSFTVDTSPGVFVAVGYDGNIIRSTDNGTNWDNATSPTENHLEEVTFGNNTFVAVGRSGNIVRSTDNGSSFDNVSSGTDQHLYGVTYGNNTFVTVGRGGKIYTSPDGTTWTFRTSGILTNLMGATFGNNTFLAVGIDGKIVRSTDNGTTWDNSTSPTENTINGVGFGNNIFVGVGNSGNIVRSSDNGSSFDNVTSSSPVQHHYEVAFGNDTFVIVQHKQKIARSEDNGTTWDNATSASSSNNFYGVEFGNNTFVTVGSNGHIYRSTDNGSSFDRMTSPLGNNVYMRSVAF